MDLQENNEKQKKIPLSIDDANFYQDAFSTAVDDSLSKNKKDPLKSICTEQFDIISRCMNRARLQEGCMVRNILRARGIANAIVNDEGEFDLGALSQAIAYLQGSLYSLGPDRQNDSKYQERMLEALIELNTSKALLGLIKNVDKPAANQKADEIIRDTLQLKHSEIITNAHARRAVLSAWLSMLRQSVGSCFATAPGIIIHDEQPQLFIKDLISLLNTGRLTRVVKGIEYSVPLSHTWGTGDLNKPFSLSTDSHDIGFAPGLIAAFQAVDLIKEDSSLKDQAATFMNPSQASVERGKTRSKQSVLNEEGMVNAMPDEEDLSGKATAERSLDEFMKVAAKAIAVNQLIKNISKTFTQYDSRLIVTADQIIRTVLLKNLNITEQDLKDYKNRPQNIIASDLVVPTSYLSAGGKGESCSNFFTKYQKACTAFKSLADNALLKSWEYTLASFSETKSQFTRWNLYASLGFGNNEKGGIGVCIYEFAKQQLDKVNRLVNDSQLEYEQVYAQLKVLEGRMQNPASERDAQWLRVEYQSRRNEFNTLEEIRNKNNAKAHQFANLYSYMLECYDDLFPTYFQEVYDADMHDISANFYDDSPAGFRLLYKYGRNNTSQWSYIYTSKEFADALAAFFVATETEITSSPNAQGIENEVSAIVTILVNHVRTKDFMESALHRMAIAHKTPLIADPLSHLDHIEKKPWAYTSGGNINTLISCYYKLDNNPTEIARWVESPLELCVFLIDTIKQIPPKTMGNFLSSRSKYMLTHSPTHAFLLKPLDKLFKAGWESDLYTYTWVRDTIIIPRKKFIEKIWLDEEMIQYLLRHLLKDIHVEHQQYFTNKLGSLPNNLQSSDFRNRILSVTKNDNILQSLNDERIDNLLYNFLPFSSRSSLRDRLNDIYQVLPGINKQQHQLLMNTFDSVSPALTASGLINANQLQDICKGIICLAFKQQTFKINYHQSVNSAAQQLGYAMPEPFIFADTNWMIDDFAFVVNPGTNEFELWRIDRIGRSGAPMSSWTEWLNGSRKDLNWGVYTNSYEYN